MVEIATLWGYTLLAEINLVVELPFGFALCEAGYFYSESGF